MKLKKQISLILAAAMTFGSVNIAFADTDNNITGSSAVKEESQVIPMVSSSDAVYPVEGGNIYYDSSTGTIKGIDDSITSVDIPSVIDGVNITSIKEAAFEYNKHLVEITIPDSITEIDNRTFRYCTGLVKVNLPDSLVSIGDYAFDGCTSLKNINLPDNVTSIGKYAFSNCSSLEEIMLPKNLSVIGKTNIAPFDNCISLKKIDVSPENPYFSSQDGVLYNKDGSELINYPAARGDSIFYVPDKVKIIYSQAFNNSELTQVYIGYNVEQVSGASFECCPELENIYVSENNYTYADADGVLTDKDCKEILKFPQKKVFTSFPEGITEIGYYAFAYNDNITNIIIPESVTKIDFGAFENCYNLKSVKITSPVEELKATFRYCISLEDVELAKGIKVIGEEAFDSCRALKNIYLPEGLKIIGPEAFNICENLKTITIPEGVEEIGLAAFYRCVSLESIELPQSLSRIDEEAFRDTGLKTVTIPRSIKDLNFDNIFVENNDLTEVNFQDGTQKIKFNFSYEFYKYLDKLTLSVPPSVNSILFYHSEYMDKDKLCIRCMENSYAHQFAEENNIKYILVDGSEFNILNVTGKCGDNAYYNIYGGTLTIYGSGSMYDYSNNYVASMAPWRKYDDRITDIVIAHNITSVGAYAFANMIPDTVSISDTVTYIDDTAFYDADVFIQCVENSYAEEYAYDNYIPYDYIDSSAFDVDLTTISTETTTENTTVSTEITTVSSEVSTENTTKPTTVTESTTETTTSTTETTTESTTLNETTTESTTESTTITETTTVTESTTASTTEPDYVISGSSIVVPVEGGNVYIDKDSGEVADCDEGVVSVNIPDKVNGIEVKSISATAFAGCKDLKTITIPDTIIAIGENAFSNCVSLTEIYCTKGSYADNKAFYPENTKIKYNEVLLYGDADGNGSLEASDAAAVLQKVLKSTYKLPLEDFTPDYEKYLDVDGNGKLEASDAAMILQKVLKSTYIMNVEK